MKKSIIIILIIISNQTNVTAQTNYTPVGLWKYISGADTISMYFKRDQVTDGITTNQLLIGFHKYIKNGIVMESTFHDTNTVFLQNKYSLIMFFKNQETVVTEGCIKDINLNNNRYIFLKKINPTTIKVSLTYIQGVRNNRPYGFTLPRQFILTKQ